LYDWECRHVLHRDEQDLAFWWGQAREAGNPVLELACGTGRLTQPLADAGVEVVGLDCDPVMLAAAQRRHRRQTASQTQNHRGPLFLAADMRRFALNQRFRLIFVGYNSLQLLTTPGDMVVCLRQARAHLAPGGRIGVEVTDFQVGGADGAEGVGPPLLLADADGIRLAGTLVHDVGNRTSCYRRHFDGEGWSVEDEVAVRSLNINEVTLMFREAGLTPQRSWAAGPMARIVAIATGGPPGPPPRGEEVGAAQRAGG
jgi:SAM-dependent methyltransferase